VAVASLAAGYVFFAFWLWLLPKWFGFRVEMAHATGWRWITAVLSIVGFSIALRCVWDFGRIGRGTPAPFAPPKRLVVEGFYRHVRNPIYVGGAAGWMGLWIVFGHASLLGIIIAAAVVLGVHLFVVFYEEPTLRSKFGVDYEEYCRNVRRWWPRIRGWDRTP
jgi:protein-S-isoprenylcysteine O-methyltransferase Ste14